MPKNIMPTPSREFLMERLSYCQETGHFTWLVNGRGINRKVGLRAGRINGYGYLVIKVSGRTLLAHRLAWLFVTGSWPTAEMDHINRVRDDNRFCNLREATIAQNRQNTLGHSSRRYSYKGVKKRANRKRWTASIFEGGKSKHLGTFDTEEEAGKAYIDYVNSTKGEFSPWNEDLADMNMLDAARGWKGEPMAMRKPGDA